MKESPFIAVLKRELDRMVSRRIYFASCIVLPLFSIFFMATIFGNGQMENLPVGVVDGDNTATSREIIRMTEAVPTFRITRHYADEAEARADVQRKSIYGYLSIPSGFEAKVMDGKETALTYYYHYALMLSLIHIFLFIFALQTMKRKYIDALYTDCQVDYILSFVTFSCSG